MTLFDAARLSLRSGAGLPLARAHLRRPAAYQFVPLIMALRLSPVRLLIADNSGVGKTIEAAMIARELLDRGLARRRGVLCPAHLCDQWERALREKFAIETDLGKWMKARTRRDRRCLSTAGLRSLRRRRAGRLRADWAGRSGRADRHLV